MRIWFLWKGGSGKTTLSAAFASYLNTIWKNTLFIDADVNAHSHTLVWIPSDKLIPISHKWKEIQAFVKGNRTDIQNIPFLSCIPPNNDSNFITLDAKNPLFSQISIQNKNWLFFMSIWSYENEDTGFTCYHGKSDNFITFLNHLLDTKDDYVVVDSVTGIDNIGTALIYSYDVNILVIEPTNKSLAVYNDFLKCINKLDYSVNYFVVCNKVADEDDIHFLQQHIPSEKILWYIQKSKSMKRFDQWDENAFDDFIQENTDTFKNIFSKINGITRDLEQYQKNIERNFLFNTQKHYNKFYGITFSDIIETQNFSFKNKYTEWTLQK